MKRKNDILVYQLTRYHPDDSLVEMDDFERKRDTLWTPNPMFASLEEAQVASFSLMDEIMEWKEVSLIFFGCGKKGWCTESTDGTELFIHEMEVTW